MGQAPQAAVAPDALDGLYLGEFDDFVAARNELAKQLRAQGDREAADGVRGLKKPSRVAWAINQLGERKAKLGSELLAAGAALREAQERLVAGTADSAELRQASEREQAAVRSALDAAVALSEDAGAKLAPAAVERARQTLHAVALDDSVRSDFEQHRLTTEHEAAGLGDFSPGAVPPARRRAQKARPKLKSAEAEARKLEESRADAEREAEAAREAAERAQRDLSRAAKALDKATSKAAAARERVEALRKE